MSLLRRFFKNRSVLGRRRAREKMGDFQAAEETAFVVDEVSHVVKEATERDMDGDTIPISTAKSINGPQMW